MKSSKEYHKNAPFEPTERHIMLEVHPHPQSFAFLLQLNTYYQNQEESPKFRWAFDSKYRHGIMQEIKERITTAHNGDLCCEYCGKLMNDYGKRTNKHDEFTIDHIIPKALGGSFAQHTNLAGACAQCNNEKGIHKGYRLPDGTLTWEHRGETPSLKNRRKRSGFKDNYL